MNKKYHIRRNVHLILSMETMIPFNLMYATVTSVQYGRDNSRAIFWILAQSGYKIVCICILGVLYVAILKSWLPKQTVTSPVDR